MMINEGVIFDIGSPSNVLTSENIAKVYGVKANVMGDSKLTNTANRTIVNI